MDKDKYNKLVEDCNNWINKQNEYFEKRINIIKKYRDDEVEQEKQVKLLEDEYGANNWNFYFGPWIEIYSKDDLLNKEFILPGHDYCFLNLPDRDPQEILNAFGKNITNCLGEYRGVVIGYGYDMRDDYLLTEIRDENGNIKRSSVMLNEKYQIL